DCCFCRVSVRRRGLPSFPTRRSSDLTTKLAPKRFVGQMMGVWFLAMSLGNLIAGQIAGDFDPNDLRAYPGQYMQIVLTAGGTGLILLLFTKPIKKLMGGID